MSFLPLPFSDGIAYLRYSISKVVKFGFSEKANKIGKNLRRTFDKSVVFCARNSVLVKKSTKIFQNNCGQVVLYKLYLLCYMKIYD